MEYSIAKLSKLAGVSARTLRYYDEIGLLAPARISKGGYRVYGDREVDLLQQILFYREMGVSLDEIKKIVLSKEFDGAAALTNHLATLRDEQGRLNRLIETVEKSIRAMKGETTMTDREKFEGFKDKALLENEEKYGGELREKYGADAVVASNQKFKNMTKERYEGVQALSLALNKALKEAFLQGDPSSDLSQKVCAMHKEWLCCFWGSYTKEAHCGVAQMYVDDPRFTKYYDEIAVGCAAFLRDAVEIYCR